jgi:hypothetical protein
MSLNEILNLLSIKCALHEILNMYVRIKHTLSEIQNVLSIT